MGRYYKINETLLYWIFLKYISVRNNASKNYEPINIVKILKFRYLEEIYKNIVIMDMVLESLGVELLLSIS